MAHMGHLRHFGRTRSAGMPQEASFAKGGVECPPYYYRPFLAGILPIPRSCRPFGVTAEMSG